VWVTALSLVVHYSKQYSDAPRFAFYYCRHRCLGLHAHHSFPSPSAVRRSVVRPGRVSPLHRIFSLWLACHTQEEIAEEVGVPQRTVADVLAESAELPDSLKPIADHLIDFEVSLYNVWKQSRSSAPARSVLR
jgi:hypothetical protein